MFRYYVISLLRYIVITLYRPIIIRDDALEDDSRCVAVELRQQSR